VIGPTFCTDGRMSILKFDETEKTIIRYLARNFDKGETWTDERKFPGVKEVGIDRIYEIRSRFIGLGWLYWVREDSAFSSSLKVDPVILEVAHELDNPELPNYWETTTAWFFSKPWSVPLVAIVVLLPILVQWVQWGIALYGWATGQEVAPKE
jgi:hypothetical protein